MAKQTSASSISRREFLRLAAALGGAAAAASFLEACSQAGIDPTAFPVPSPSPFAPQPSEVIEATPTSLPQSPTPAPTRPFPSATPTEMLQEGIARVAFVKTGDRAEGVRRAVALLGTNPVAEKKVFLKPNFNSADPAPGSTHPDVLAALVASLQHMGAQQINLGDRSGMGDTRQVMQQAGVFRLAKEMNFDALVLDELDEDGWVRMEPPGSHWRQGFALARPCVEAEAVVQACCLKTHRYGGHFTLSLKNSVGLVAKRLQAGGHDFMQELHGSNHQRRMIAEINAAYKPDLIILDGVEAFISGGPDVGERVAPQVMLAGADRVAIDALGVALLRYFGSKTEVARGKIFKQEQIARAVELGLGVDSPEKIEILVDDPDSAAYSEKIRKVLLA